MAPNDLAILERLAEEHLDPAVRRAVCAALADDSFLQPTPENLQRLIEKNIEQHIEPAVLRAVRTALRDQRDDSDIPPWLRR